MSRALALFATLAALLSGPGGAEEVQNPLQDSATWKELRPDVAGDRTILDGSGVLTLDAPFRANDAATVPVHITQTGPGQITRLMLIVDENPAPVAAEFSFGPAMPVVDLETRVRVNEYSNVRALAEMADGRLLMVGRFVRASGGCSAPAGKDAEAALASIGKMKARWYDQGSSDAHVAQVMLRHPNYSGLQRNQITQLFIPAHFVDELEVRAGDALVFSLSGGISISEDPTFRFSYTAPAGTALTVRASDTEGAVFQSVLPEEAGRS